MKTFKLIILILILTSPILYGGQPGGFVMTANIPFKGQATGGMLIFAKVTDRNASFVSIDTLSGESGQSVVYKLAKAIANSDAIYEFSHAFRTVNGKRVEIDRDETAANMAQGDTLRLANFANQMYFLAGSEKGFGIPQPPLSLSCIYNKEKDEITLNWINPPGNYDYIYFRLSWGQIGGSLLRDGNSTSLVISRPIMVERGFNLDSLDIRVYGFRNNLASNVGAIYVENQCTIQSETFGVPFTNDIAPNWSAWSSDKNVESDAFKQGEKFPDMKSYNPALSLSTKPFYQVIKSSKSGNIHGIYRKFLGLIPGHTYRIIADLTTLDMNSANTDWSASLCATYNRGKDDLTAKQMAGLSALPNGKKGIQAGEIASFGKGKNHTQGKFKIVGSNSGSNITLPNDVNSITVWVRFNCKDPNGKIGFSGVKLEDITENENIKSLEQIQEEESHQKDELIRMEKNYRERKNLPQLQIE